MVEVLKTGNTHCYYPTLYFIFQGECWAYPHILDMWACYSSAHKLFLTYYYLLCLFIYQQEMLNISKKSTSCFVNFSRLQQITDIQAEIYQVNFVGVSTIHFCLKESILISSNNFLACRMVSRTQLCRLFLAVVNNSSNHSSNEQQQQQQQGLNTKMKSFHNKSSSCSL